MKHSSRSGFLGTITGGLLVNPAASRDTSIGNIASPQKTSGIKPYTGAWQKEQILHLTRRTLFGVTPADYNYFSKLTLSQCLDVLLTPSPLPPPPVNADNKSNYTDPEVSFGKTRIGLPKNEKGVDNEKRVQSLRAWWIGLMAAQDRSVTAKIMLFWHNHIAAEFPFMHWAQTAYTYVAPLRLHAMGNFKKLILDITTTPGMLQYLSGDQNTATAPNENYSRELQELFTVGKGPGSHYTQDDVVAAARVLTGWTVAESQVDTIFLPHWHDTGDKHFSAFYNNTVIKGRKNEAGAREELNELVNMIFNTREVASNLCRRLYRWFVNSAIDHHVEVNIIEPLTDICIENKYEVLPVLKVLLNSEHFFDPLIMGEQVKNPADHLIGFCRQFNTASYPNDLAKQYRAWYLISRQLYNTGMNPGDPPNVAGWPAHYLYPVYDKLWINSDTLVARYIATDRFLSPEGYAEDTPEFSLHADVLGFTAQLSNPSDMHQLIADSTALLGAVGFDTEQTTYLKNILLGTTADEQAWTKAWTNYTANPDDATAKKTVTDLLREYYTYLMQQAECHLM